MEKRYSEMTEHELRQEITTLNDKAKKAEQMGMVNELAVYERKALMAKSYLLDPADYKPGESYELNDGEGTKFTISYMNGIFAWGYREGSDRQKEEEAFPIALLIK